MVSKQKIIIMTRLAIYDKNEGDNDRQTNQFFRHDFIYRKNIWTRLSAGIGSLMLLALYWLQLLFVDGGDIFEMDLQGPVTDSVLFLLAVLAVYSLIGTITGTRQYYLVQKRLERYQALLNQLERVNKRARQRQE